MEELSFTVKTIMVIFGLGGLVALSIVPWLCIGDGILDKPGKKRKYCSSLK